VYTQHETETGQTAYTRLEPDTGQTAYTSVSTSSPQPEEDRRTASLLLKQGLTALPRLQLKPIDDDGAPLSGARAVARQTKEETSVESDFSRLQLEDTVNRLPPEPQVYDFRSKPETEMRQTPERPVVQFCTGIMPENPRTRQNFTTVETSVPHTGLELIGTVYHVARDDSCYREEPLAKPEMEIQGEESPPSEGNLVHEDTHDGVPIRRRRKGEVEANAKAGTTRHLLCHLSGTSRRVIDAADAKVGLNQHPSPEKSNSSSQDVGD